jgi:hypothetical protein
MLQQRMETAFSNHEKTWSGEVDVMYVNVGDEEI